MSLARRVALVDLDWAETDAILRALRDDRVDVRLVLGTRDDEPGVRVADLLGVPHSIEVGDLTRELFDLAVIGDGSPRRAALERLLDALGTPVLGPSTFPDSADASVVAAAGSALAERPGTPGSRLDEDRAPGEAADPWNVFETDVVFESSAPEPIAEATPARGGTAPAGATGARAVDAEAFAACVARAVERHRHEDAVYMLHRFRLEGDVDRSAALAEALPAVFRATDVVFRADARTWVLLCAGASTDPGRVDRRLRRAWRRVHRHEAAVLPLRHESVALSAADDTRPFAAAADAWLAAR